MYLEYVIITTDYLTDREYINIYTLYVVIITIVARFLVYRHSF